MNRRSFLKLPALLPFVGSGSEDHHFQYESVIGTSMDVVVCTADSGVADGVCQTIRGEIDRLARVLDTRDPASEISQLQGSGVGLEASPALTDVLHAYEHWERRTGGVFSIRPAGAGTPRNVDALGKAYIIDRAAAAAVKLWPSIDVLLLNLGGDIVVWGRSREIAIANPAAWYDNAQPLSAIDLRNQAVATSGSYARGAHLCDSRSGTPLRTSVAATVVAPNAVTANALATTLCLTSADDGLRLVESTPGAEALRIESGSLQRTSGFALLERRFPPQPPASTPWPSRYQLTIALPLTSGRSSKRPYVAVWVEDSSNKLIRVLAIWGTKPKYHPDLSTLWARIGGNVQPFRSVTRATRSAGRYDLIWDGLDNEHKPVALGSYRITVETNQENGTYAKQTGSIELGDRPTTITLPATTNFDSVLVKYGPA